MKLMLKGLATYQGFVRSNLAGHKCDEIRLSRKDFEILLNQSNIGLRQSMYTLRNTFVVLNPEEAPQPPKETMRSKSPEGSMDIDRLIRQAGGLVFLDGDGSHTAERWQEICVAAQSALPPLNEHLETWGNHCGAPFSVYRGHLVRMLLDILKQS